MKRWSLLGWLVGLVTACATPALGQARTLEELKADIAAFAGAARATLLSGSSPVRVEERLIAGFQQDPVRRTNVAGGGVVYWGWQEGQAFVQSVAVYDAHDNLKLLAAVDDLPRVYDSRSNRGVTSLDEYQALLDRQARWGSHPSVALFVQAPADLHAHLPLVKRWSQAALMGYSVDCADERAAASCAFVEQVSLPTRAFDVHCLQRDDAQRCHMEVPDVPALDVPLCRFVQ